MKKNSIILILLLSLIVIGNITVDAETVGSDFSVAPISSAHQLEGVDSYFDIRWAPSEKDTFSLKVSNNTDENQIYTIQLNKAKTNINGIVDYSSSKEDDNYELLKITNIPNEVEVPANQTKTVNGMIDFPNNSFNGVLMGGLHVFKKLKEGNNVTVSNRISYNIPFVIRGNIDKRPIPKIELRKVAVEKHTSESYSINCYLNNVEANLLKNTEYKIVLRDKNGRSIKTQKNTIDITPNTKFTVPISLPSNLKKGMYSVNISVIHDNKEKWTFTNKIQINQKNIDDIHNSEKNHSNKIDSTPIYLLITILFVIALFLGIILKKIFSK